MRTHTYRPGDLVIYTVSKQSPTPGPRARAIQPSEYGEDYTYVVDKFWMVSELVGDNQVQIITRRGKTRTVSIDDPLLRKAGWWQRFRYRDRFPSPESLQSTTAAAPQS
ncbi:MAG: hypothetical protein JNM43_28855 [Planctomycetaceae bacterium]|nr:hypothetical protein [Planctomycetaceae bacterium]